MPEQVLSPEKQPREKPFPWRCPNCRQLEVNRVTMPYRCQRTHGGRVVTVEIPKLAVPRCSNCGEVVFDYAADEQIRAAFRNQFGPAETGTKAATVVPPLKEKCRRKLIEVAVARTVITFGELASHLRIANQGPWNMLNEIYKEEVDAGRPDLTLLVVKANRRYPPYLCRGGAAQGVKFDPKNHEHLKAWHAELARIYETWAPVPEA